MDEWVNEWMNEWINEWMNEWMNYNTNIAANVSQPNFAPSCFRQNKSIIVFIEISFTFQSDLCFINMTF